MSDYDADAIAGCVLRAFDALSASRKPRGPSSGLGAGRREWVPLAGIVVEGRAVYVPFCHCPTSYHDGEQILESYLDSDA